LAGAAIWHANGQVGDAIKVLVAIPQLFRRLVLTGDTLAALRSCANVTLNEDEHNWSEDELVVRLSELAALIGSWGLARLTPHIAGMRRDPYHGLAQEMADKIRRLFVTHEPKKYEITHERLARMA
jgi:hypothetical protein